MLHRVAALSLHCVPLRHSLVQRFIQLGVPRAEGQAVAAIALRADSVASLFLSSHYPRNSRFLNSSIEFAFFFFCLFFSSFVKYHRYIRNRNETVLPSIKFILVHKYRPSSFHPSLISSRSNRCGFFFSLPLQPFRYLRPFRSSSSSILRPSVSCLSSLPPFSLSLSPPHRALFRFFARFLFSDFISFSRVELSFIRPLHLLSLPAHSPPSRCSFSALLSPFGTSTPAGSPSIHASTETPSLLATLSSYLPTILTFFLPLLLP